MKQEQGEQDYEQEKVFQYRVLLHNPPHDSERHPGVDSIVVIGLSSTSVPTANRAVGKFKCVRQPLVGDLEGTNGQAW